MTLASWFLYAYFRIALFFGAKMHVYNVSGRWGLSTKPMPRRYGAAWEIQKYLVKHCGFFACPSCGWATEIRDEHIAKGEGYCYGYFYGNPGVPWDQETDPQLAYDKMPDRLRHWPA